VRLLVGTDFHGSEGVWRKFLNAVHLGIWPVDAVLYAGDLAGKAFIPITQTGRGWTAKIRGIERRARNEAELARLQRDIADLGMYSEVITGQELGTLSHAAAERLFDQAIRQRLQSWLALAEERLAPKGVPLFVIPGNDDPAIVDDVLATAGYAVNVDRRPAHLPDGREIVGLSPSNPTPWNTPRELSEDDLGTEAERLLSALDTPDSAVAMLHAPPAGLLDQAPKLDGDLRPVLTGTGDLTYVSVGSTAYRDVLQRFQPALAIHGHIHEAGGHASLGQTLCINPGSEYFSGILKAYVVELDRDSIRPIRAEA
jgi:Icc-related predicted phosphoesterase